MKAYMEQIDKYLNHELIDLERAAFEEALTTDEDLRRALYLQLEMRDALNEDSWSFLQASNQEDAVKALEAFFRSQEAVQLREKFKKVGNTQPIAPRNRSRKFWWVAASLIVMLGASYLFWPKTQSPQELFAEYVVVDQMPSFVARSSSGDDLLQQGQLAFEEEAYTQSLEIFESYLNTTEEVDARVYSYIFKASLLLDDIASAQKALNTLEHTNSFEAQKADWYYALFYLHQERIAESKERLEIILSDSKNYQYIQAQELLNKLK